MDYRTACFGRSPHGERGLKYIDQVKALARRVSRSPHGERGLKFGEVWPDAVDGPRRSPHGERGLKFQEGDHRVRRRVALLMESVD